MTEFLDEAEALQTNLEGIKKLSDSLATFNESFASWLYVMNMNALTTDWTQDTHRRFLPDVSQERAGSLLLVVLYLTRRGLLGNVDRGLHIAQPLIWLILSLSIQTLIWFISFAPSSSAYRTSNVKVLRQNDRQRRLQKLCKEAQAEEQSG
ncbi:hypothetical protein BKA70DRAFT_398818 [Coprinopsis sp. MPI-PUGE-AT-0042]|nr:hypothetical protein BKA70DRAFT_398818 [Coprinopsis sp. MPI-PUGE-AT-0042]